jgi:hypothetical protein
MLFCILVMFWVWISIVYNWVFLKHKKYNYLIDGISLDLFLHLKKIAQRRSCNWCWAWSISWMIFYRLPLSELNPKWATPWGMELICKNMLFMGGASRCYANNNPLLLWLCFKSFVMVYYCASNFNIMLLCLDF